MQDAHPSRDARCGLWRWRPVAPSPGCTSRYTGGDEALTPLRRGPKVPANLTSAALEDEIVAWRKRLAGDGLDAGARTIHWHLSDRGVDAASSHRACSATREPLYTASMRYIVYGAGAIGGAIGGRLAHAGHDVILITRGAHLDALRTGGLRLVTPDEELHPPVRVVGSPAEAAPEPGDVVILAMKSQGTEVAVCELDAVIGRDVAVFCAQNGVDNERVASRRGADTYAMCVVLPATHLEPGAVFHHAAPVGGILDVGRYPAGIDETSERVAADLRDAMFESRADPKIMRWKYAKLLNNLGNALDAACGMEGRRGDLFRRARAEGEACYEAAGIDYASSEEDRERRTVMSPLRSAGGMEHQGSSSWQSLARNTGNIEADWLNGEIVLLGRLHDVATPVNEVLRRLANRMARDRVPPGSLSTEQIEAEVRQFEAALPRPSTAH